MEHVDPHDTPLSPIWKMVRVGAMLAGMGAVAFTVASLGRGMFPPEPSLAAEMQPNVIQTSGESSASLSSDRQTSRNVEVLGEQDANSPYTLRSERFRLDQVSMAGDIVLSEDNSDIGKLEIPFVRGESFLEKNKKDVKVLITWKTTKSAQSKLTYSKNNNADFSETVEEGGYGTDHSIVLSGLEQASTYVYSIAARDHDGNEVSTDSYAVYTGTKTASLFDLISGAFTDVFGWTMKK